MSGIRVVRGKADEADIAALTAVLLAVRRQRWANVATVPADAGPAAAGWDRARPPGHRPAGSWRSG
ncbi:acyl-CoA carboxylase subunit epsilon [Streptomyces sp. NPDC102441]|uniref:acyl-CoA carboxylase subunit epsilon n=1 Tax=Streptomyces sp. NPDC102441 TaxID=3366176 RepID=UPI0038194D55